MPQSIGSILEVANHTNTSHSNMVNHIHNKHTSETNGKCLSPALKMSCWNSKLQKTTLTLLAVTLHHQHQPQLQLQPQHQAVEVVPHQELLANQLIGNPEVWLLVSKTKDNVVDAGHSPLLDVSVQEEPLLDIHFLTTLSNNSLIAPDHMETMVAVVESWNLLSNTLR